MPMHCRFYDDKGWTFIFYTGKQPLIITDRSILGPMVMLFKVSPQIKQQPPRTPRMLLRLHAQNCQQGRPDLRHVVSNIVNNLECGVPLSEDLVARGMAADFEIFFKGDADKCRDDVQKALRTLTAGELFDLCVEESARFDVKMRPRLNADLCTRTGIRHVFERQVWRAKELLDPDVYVRNAFNDLRILETDVISRLQFQMLLQLLLKAEPVLASARESRRNAFRGVSCLSICIFERVCHSNIFLQGAIPLARRKNSPHA